jgi:hypothetical protein
MEVNSSSALAISLEELPISNLECYTRSVRYLFLRVNHVFLWFAHIFAVANRWREVGNMQREEGMGSVGPSFWRLRWAMGNLRRDLRKLRGD